MKEDNIMEKVFDACEENKIEKLKELIEKNPESLNINKIWIDCDESGEDITLLEKCCMALYVEKKLENKEKIKKVIELLLCYKGISVKSNSCFGFIDESEYVTEFKSIKWKGFKIKYQNKPWCKENYKHYSRIFKKNILTLLYIHRHKRIQEETVYTQKGKKMFLFDIPKDCLIFIIFTYFSYDHFK